MRKIWSDEAWEEYLYWQSQDKKTLKRINALIKSIERDGVMQENDGNETAITYNFEDPINPETGGMYVAVTYGDDHSVDPFSETNAYHMKYTANGCVLIVLHNHPSLSKISLQDVSYLLYHDPLKMIIAVTNRGSITYIVKSSKLKYVEAVRMTKAAVDEYNAANGLKEKQDITNKFLSNCHKVGLIYDDH